MVAPMWLLLAMATGMAHGAKKTTKLTKKNLAKCQVAMDTLMGTVGVLRQNISEITAAAGLDSLPASPFQLGSSFSTTGAPKPSGRQGASEARDRQGAAEARDPRNRTVAALDRSTGSDATNVILIGDATYSDGTKRCGQGQTMSMTINLDVGYFVGSSTANTATRFFSTLGMYITGATGYYNICGFLRFAKGGNAVDVNIMAGSSVGASFGDALGDDWRTTGTCFLALLTSGQPITMQVKSTGSSDCIEETSYKYSRLTAYLIAPTTT